MPSGRSGGTTRYGALIAALDEVEMAVAYYRRSLEAEKIRTVTRSSMVQAHGYPAVALLRVSDPAGQEGSYCERWTSHPSTQKRESS